MAPHLGMGCIRTPLDCPFPPPPLGSEELRLWLCCLGGGAGMRAVGSLALPEALADPPSGLS
eukprot:6689130-Alexandrium_andersonii.AAC.1